MCVCVCVEGCGVYDICENLFAVVSTWVSENGAAESWLCFHHVGSGAGNQVTRLGCQSLYSFWAILLAWEWLSFKDSHLQSIEGERMEKQSFRNPDFRLWSANQPHLGDVRQLRCASLLIVPCTLPSNSGWLAQVLIGTVNLVSICRYRPCPRSSRAAELGVGLGQHK